MFSASTVHSKHVLSTNRKDSNIESTFPHSGKGVKDFQDISRTGLDPSGNIDQSFDTFEKGLNNLKSQFGNGETSDFNIIPSNIESTNNVFKLNRRRPVAKQILKRQRISPKGSNGTPFTVFNRPSSTRSEVGKQYPV